MELTLLCANAAADHAQLLVERKRYHDQLEQRIRQILPDIQTRRTLIAEHQKSLSQMIRYFQSVSYEKPLHTIRRRLSTLQHTLPTECEISVLINQIGFLTEDWDTQVQKDLFFARRAAGKAEREFLSLLEKVRQEPAPLYDAFKDAERCLEIKYDHDYCRQLIQVFKQAIV